MDMKTVLNAVGDFKGFIVKKVWLDGKSLLVVELGERKNGRGSCSICRERCPGYDREPHRYWDYLPVFSCKVIVGYSPRRVECPEDGVVVEWMPWSVGKHTFSLAYMWFLARWAKRLAVKEVAEVFRTSWDQVFDAVDCAVEWGLAHRDVSGVAAIGVDELQYARGQNYVTLVYQIDEGCRRLLWIGKDRTKETLRSCFDFFGEQWSAGIKFACTDMWRNYIDVIAEKARNALNVLDRYHLAAMMNKAIDEVRAKEVKRLQEDGKEPILKDQRWIFLKRPENLTDKQHTKLRELVQYNLRTVRSYLLKLDFESFWDYVSPYWAARFMDKWCNKTMRSRIEPMKKIAKTLRAHKPLILNWFKARRAAVSLGAVEGFNNKAGLIKRRSYGFRTYPVLEVMLYHGLGELPEPDFVQRLYC